MESAIDIRQVVASDAVQPTRAKLSRVGNQFDGGCGRSIAFASSLSRHRTGNEGRMCHEHLERSLRYFSRQLWLVKFGCPRRTSVLPNKFVATRGAKVGNSFGGVWQTNRSRSERSAGDLLVLVLMPVA